MKEIENYARFYGLLSRMRFNGDREELKTALVRSFTEGRTDSLHQMRPDEYEHLCSRLEEQLGVKEERAAQREMLRKHRSCCLKLMTTLGVMTGDWQRVNEFCRHPRIAGKDFALLTIDELIALQKKLRAIERAGGLKPKKEPTPAAHHQVEYMQVHIGAGGEA